MSRPSVQANGDHVRKQRQRAKRKIRAKKENIKLAKHALKR